MADSEDFLEEEYYGSRCFRKRNDGSIVEVHPDGSLRENFEIGGEMHNGYSMTMDILEEKIEDQWEREESGLNVSQEEASSEVDANVEYDTWGEKIIHKEKKPTMKEIMDKAMEKWGVGSTSIDGGGQLDSGRDLESASGFGSSGSTKLTSKREAETFSSHMAKVNSAYKKNEKSTFKSKLSGFNSLSSKKSARSNSTFKK